MIHFDFIVTDEDAENIFDCINSEINRCFRRSLLSDTKKLEADYLEKHREYLNSLKVKMKNTRVE